MNALAVYNDRSRRLVQVDGSICCDRRTVVTTSVVTVIVDEVNSSDVDGGDDDVDGSGEGSTLVGWIQELQQGREREGGPRRIKCEYVVVVNGLLEIDLTGSSRFLGSGTVRRRKGEEKRGRFVDMNGTLPE